MNAAGEDDCYVLMISTEVKGGKRVEGNSRLNIFDAKSIR